jgi:hypothetical protein
VFFDVECKARMYCLVYDANIINSIGFDDACIIAPIATYMSRSKKVEIEPNLAMSELITPNETRTIGARDKPISAIVTKYLELMPLPHPVRK